MVGCFGGVSDERLAEEAWGIHIGNVCLTLEEA